MPQGFWKYIASRKDVQVFPEPIAACYSPWGALTYKIDRGASTDTSNQMVISDNFLIKMRSLGDRLKKRVIRC